MLPIAGIKAQESERIYAKEAAQEKEDVTRIETRETHAGEDEAVGAVGRAFGGGARVARGDHQEQESRQGIHVVVSRARRRTKESRF